MGAVGHPRLYAGGVPSRHDSPTPASDVPSESGPLTQLTEPTELDDLVGEWTTVPDVAERYGVSLAQVRQWIADRLLLSVRTGERHVVSLPAKFFDDDGPRPELKGTFTVLSDGGMDDADILRWLYTPDDTLPVPGAPIDSIVAGHKTEVRRRAMLLAF